MKKRTKSYGGGCCCQTNTNLEASCRDSNGIIEFLLHGRLSQQQKLGELGGGTLIYYWNYWEYQRRVTTTQCTGKGKGEVYSVYGVWGGECTKELYMIVF